MELNFLNEQGKTVDVNEAVFGREYNEALVHQIVVAFQANARLGTRAQLTREAVHHSTKKPWRQKGTGRARSGMTSSPVWRGGGRAMASIWSKLVADERLCVVESFAVESPKTKAFATQLKTMGLQNKVLLVVGAEELTDNLILASRNMKDVLVVPTRYADPLCLLYFDKVVVTKAAVSEIEEMLA